MNHSLRAVRGEIPASMRPASRDCRRLVQPHEAPVSLLSGAAGASPLLVLTAALWLAVAAWIGVQRWEAMLADASVETAEWGDK